MIKKRCGESEAVWCEYRTGGRKAVLNLETSVGGAVGFSSVLQE